MHGAAGLARGPRQLGPVPGEVGHGLSGQYLQQHGAGITGVHPVQDRGHWYDRGDGRRRGQLGIDDRGRPTGTTRFPAPQAEPELPPSARSDPASSPNAAAARAMASGT
jgi:hypothetical protein